MKKRSSLKKGYKILLIEDERRLIMAIKPKLEDNDFVVVTASDYQDAINAYEKINDLDVIWLDHYLLGPKTGLDFLMFVREQHAEKEIPIFAISNTGSHDKKERYLELGATKYFIKSDYMLESIIQSIKNYLDSYYQA